MLIFYILSVTSSGLCLLLERPYSKRRPTTSKINKLVVESAYKELASQGPYKAVVAKMKAGTGLVGDEQKVKAVDEAYNNLKDIHDQMLNLIKLAYYSEKLKEAVESQSASSSRGNQSAGGSPAGGQTSTTKSQIQSASSSSQSQSSQSSSQPASSGSRSTQQTRPGGTSGGTTPTNQSSSQSTGTGTSAGQVSQSSITESQPKSSSSETDQSSSGSGTGTGTGTEGTVVTKLVEPTKVTLDIEKTQSTSEFEYSKDDKIHTYTVKDGHVFNKVSKGTDEVWDSKGGECGTKVIFIDERDKYVSILLSNNMFLLFNLESGTWKDITSTKHDITRLKFFGDNDATLCQNDYDVTIADYSYRFTFKAGVNCKKIKFADDEVWNDTDDPEYSTITAFDLGLISNNFFVKNKTKFKKLEFEPTQTKEGQVTEGESEVITPTTVPQTSLAILTEPPPEKASVTVMAATGKPRPKKTPEVYTGHRTAITLDIGDKASNSAVEFKEDYLKNVMVFSAKEKCVFDKIVKTSSTNCCGKSCCESETAIWEAKDETEYFHKVYVDGLGTFSRTSNLSLHLCDGTFKHFNKPMRGNWSESPDVIDLDLKISNSNIQVDYFQKDNYRIYVAKLGYTIRKVTNESVSIWTAQNEHALKVVLMGSEDTPKHLAVLLKNGELALLFKSGSGKPWQDITSTKNKITDLKMYAMADDNKYMELHGEHYSISLFNEFYGYVFYEGVGCVKVTYKGKNIWDLREEGDFGCLKGVFLDLKSNKFNVMNDDDRYWVCEEVRKVNPVTLNILSKASTDDFDFTVDHNRNINIYTSKGNAIFDRVKTISVIWKTEDPQNYATKVFADIDRANVSIYLVKGDILHFGRSDEGIWSPNPSKIILDVSETSSTISYDFVHEGETRTFTAKPGYQFKTVMLSSSWTWLVCGSSCCKSACLGDDIFWEAKNEEECSTKVTVYGVETSVKNINIFLNNNQVKHFHKADKKWVSTTTIVLDIDKNTDNDLFEYRSTRNYGHFNPKPNLTITKIVKKGVDIWTAKPEDHGLKAVLMGSGWGEKHLSILLQSGNFVLLRKVFRGYTWKDITKEKSDFSGIKMYSLEEGTSHYHELTGNDYDPIIFESRYGYEFKDSVKCVKITYNDKLLWTHTDDPEYGYLKGLYLDLPKNQFIVTNLKDQTKEVDITVALDIQKTEGTSEFYYFKDDDCQKYSAKSGHVFNKIVDGPKVIWQSSDNVFANLARSKSREDGKYLAILLTNRMFKLFKEEDNKWKDITSQRSDITKLTFLGDKDAELTSSDYTVTIADYSYQFKFNDGVKCKKVMYGDDDVWKPSDDPEYSEIKSFSLGLCSNSFIVKNQSDELKKLEFKPTTETAAVITKVSVTKPAEPTKVTLDIEKTQSTDQFDFADQNGVVTYTTKDDFKFSKVSQGTKDIWESKDNICGILVRTKTSKDVKFLVVLLTNNMFTVFHLDDNEWKDITSKRHDITKLKFLGENDAEITKTDYTVTIVDLSFTYIFNSGVSCKTIKLGDDEVWKHTDDAKFAEIKSFSLGLASNSFFVKNQSDEVKKIEKEAEAPPTPVTPPVTTPETTPVTTPDTKPVTIPEAPEEPTPVTTPEPPEEPEPVTKPVISLKAPEAEPKPVVTPVVTKFSLDIEKTQSTSQYDYIVRNGVVSYSVKPGHGFNKVSQGSKGIWESADCGILARTKLFSNNERFLTIILYNNSFKLFRQSQENTSWEDITSERLDVTKLKFLSHNDRVLRNVEFTVSFVDFFYAFNFRNISKCLKVKYGGQVVWKHTDYCDFSDITTFYFGIISNRFYVRNQFGRFIKLAKELEVSRTAEPQQPAEPTKQQATDQQSTEAEESEQSTPPTSSASSP